MSATGGIDDVAMPPPFLFFLKKKEEEVVFSFLLEVAVFSVGERNKR